MNKTLYVALLALLAPGFCGMAQTPLKKANKQYELKAFHLAIPNYEAIVKADPANQEAWLNLADCYRLTNDMKRASDAFRKAAASGKMPASYLLRYARTLMALEDYQGAVPVLKEYSLAHADAAYQFLEACHAAMQLKANPPLNMYTVSNLGLNTPAADFSPAFWKDRFVFASARTDMARKISAKSTDWTGKALNQLFTQKGKELAFLKNDLKNSFNQAPVSFSANGQWVAFARNNFMNGIRQIPEAGLESSLYISLVNEKGDWVKEEPFPYNGSGFSTSFPSLSEDGSTLVFASDRPDGFGGYDLYVSRKIGGTWSVPENLGREINTPGDEITPFFQGKFLYFASDWHLGKGGFDIFRASRNGDEFSGIIQMEGLNSSYDDYGLVAQPRGEGFLFVSNRPGGKGLEDIYQAVPKTFEVQLMVLDARNQQPLPNVTIDFSACGEGVYTTNSKGLAIWQALPGWQCKGKLIRTGFETSYIEISQVRQQAVNELVVELMRTEDLYEGLVSNPISGKPEADVLVSVQYGATGMEKSTRTNNSGKYMVYLPNPTDARVRFSKAGFLETRVEAKELSPASGKLKTLVIQPAALSVTEADLDRAEFASRNPVNSEAKQWPGKRKTIKKTIVSYAIQLGAFTAAQVPDLNKFQGVADLGTVYTVTENEKTKVRLGAFKDRESAAAALNTVKSKGYPSAFIIEEKKEVEEEVAKVRKGEKESKPEPAMNPAPTAPAPGTTPAPAPRKEEKKLSNDWWIKLGSFKNPDSFSGSAVENFGVIEHRKQGDMHLFYLYGYMTREQAAFALEKVKTAGFKDAFITNSVAGEKVEFK